MRRDYPEFVKRGAEIIAVGPEERKAFADWWHEHEMPFSGLADPDHAVARRYGQQVKIMKLGRMPAQFIVDKGGFIRYAHYGKSMSGIAEGTEILTELDKLNRI